MGEPEDKGQGQQDIQANKNLDLLGALDAAYDGPARGGLAGYGSGAGTGGGLIEDMREPVRLEENTILQDLYDKGDFKAALLLSDALEVKHSQKNRGDDQKLETAPQLIDDVFQYLHQNNPVDVGKEDMELGFQINQEIIEQFITTPEGQALRAAGTPGNLLLATMAANTVADEVLDKLSERTKKLAKKIKKASDQVIATEQKAFDKNQQAISLEEAGDLEGAVALDDEAQNDLEAAKEAAEKIRLALQGQAGFDRELIAIRVAARQAAEKAQAQIADAQNILSAFAGSEDGDQQPQGNLQEKLDLLKKVSKNPKLKQIANICGRLKELMFSAPKEMLLNNPEEVVGVTTGKDLSRLTSGERAMLADEDFRVLFDLKFFAEQLFLYQVQSRRPMGRGPLIVVVDDSGSMGSSVGDGVSREVWAKAVSLALLAVARRQGRDFAMIHFGSSDVLIEWGFFYGRSTPTEIRECLEFFFGGGTEFEHWMRRVRQIVTEHQFKSADVVVISDGECEVESSDLKAWNEDRKKTGTRVLPVLISSAGEGQVLTSLSREDGDAPEFSRVIHVNSLSGDEESAIQKIGGDILTRRV